MKKYLFLFLVFLYTSVQAQTQNYPVFGWATINPPASSQLDDYANPITNPIKLTLVLADKTIPTRQVYLEVSVEGPTNAYYRAVNNTIELNSNLFAFVPNQIIAASFAPENMSGASYNQPLSAGIYTFSFVVKDALSGSILSLPIKTAPVWIESSDPPLPLFPMNFTGVPVSQVQNVVFQWLPRHTPNINIEYEFTLTELPIANRGNTQNVFLSQPPILKQTTAFPTLIYDARFPQLRKGAVYAWRVQAKPRLGASNKGGTFLNEGFSEIFSFVYDKEIETLNPPRNLLGELSIDYDKFDISFEGDDNHVKYLVSIDAIDGETQIVEKGKNNSTKIEHILRGGSSQAYRETKIVVRAIDVFGRESAPAEYIIEPISQIQFENRILGEITIEGKIETYISNYNLGLENGKLVNTATGEKKRFEAEKASVSFYISDKPISFTTHETFIKTQESFLKSTNNGLRYMGSAIADANGNYKIRCEYLQLRHFNDVKHFYLMVRGRGAYSDAIFEVSVPKQVRGDVRTLKTETIKANTYAFLPKFVYEDGTEIPNDNFEEINLYRLKVYFDGYFNNLYKYDGGPDRTEVIYNKGVYVKVNSLKTDANGSLFDGSFLLGVKETDFDMRFFPVKDFKPYESQKIFDKQEKKDYIGIETQTFTYHPPLAHIKGQVAVRSRGSKQVFPAANIQVGIIVLKTFKDNAEVDFQGRLDATKAYQTLYKDEVTTDANGNYSLTIPEELYFNNDIDNIIVYNSIPGVYNYYQSKRILKPKTDVIVDIDLLSTGTTFASRLYNQHNEPVSGAKIVHKKSGAFATTNHLGEFIVNVPFSPNVDADPTFIIDADGYSKSPQLLSEFTKTTAPEDISDFGLSFWNDNIEALKQLTGSSYEDISEPMVHKRNFKIFNTKLISFYKKDSIKAASIEYIVRTKLYTSENNKKTYTPGTIEVRGELVDIPEQGKVQVMYTRGAVLEGKIRNRDKSAEIYYVESDFEMAFDEPAKKTDTIDVELEIKQAVYIAGVVTGYRADSTKKGAEAGVTISVEGLDDVETDENGKFVIWLEKGAEEAKLTLTKENHNETEISFSTKVKTEAEKIRDFTKNIEDDTEYTTYEELRALSLAIYQKDVTIPDFKTLQGFKVDISVIKKIDSRTFLMTGKINLEDEKSIYELEEGEELTFEDLEVTIDKTDLLNAVMVEDDTEFDQATLSLKLFGYADVESNSENEGIINFVRLEKLKLDGRESYGKIGGVSLKFLPKKMLRKVQDVILQEFELIPKLEEQQDKMGLNNDITAGNKKKLLAENKAATDAGGTGQFAVKDPAAPAEAPKPALNKFKDREKDAPIIPVFVSGGKSLTNFNEDMEFKIEYPDEDLNGVGRVDEKDSKDSLTGKKEKFSLTLGSGFSLLMDEEQEATLTKDGVIFMGSLGLPKMEKIGIEGKMPLVEKLLLAPEEDLPMRELRLLKKPDSTGKTTPYFTLGVANSWRFEVTKFQVFDEFSSVGFGGKIYTDQTNHLIVHSMSIRKGPDGRYPFLDMEFPEQGFKVKMLVMKSPKDQRIICGYNFEDNAYEIEAGVKMEVTKDAAAFIKEVFPLEVEKLVYNTAGKFFVSINLGKSVNIGPVKVNIRKVMFNKGGGVSWPEMLQMLRRTTEENNAFVKTIKYNNINYREINKDSTINRKTNIDAKELMEKIPEVKLATGEVDWAFGFAGGVEITTLKGVNCKGDASFVVGEREGELSFQFNSIDIMMQSTAFKGYASLELSTEGDRIGFAGRGEYECLTRKWAATVKFFKIPNGIELGISFVASAMIPTGSITWSSVGGGIDMNTATNKYSVFFLGSAYATGSSPEAAEFKAIKIEVLFETDICGPLPVVKGSADLYLKNEKFCSAKMTLDFCRLMVFLHIDCNKEIVPGTIANVTATAFITTKSFFLGASIKTVILGLNANAILLIGINNAFVGDRVPNEVKYYAELITKKSVLTSSELILNGIYIGATVSIEKKFSGNIIVFAWSFKMASSNTTVIYKSFSNFDIFISNDFKFSAAVYAKIGVMFFSLEAYGGVDVRALIEGGYNAEQGFNFLADVGVSVWLGNSISTSCNNFKIKWCSENLGLFRASYPCELNWKFCIEKGLGVQYRQRGSEAGTKIKLNLF